MLSLITIITSVCHNSSIAALPTMGMWPNFWRMEHSLCISRTKVNYSWIGLNSLSQNIWVFNIAGDSPTPKSQKGLPHLNLWLHWGVGKQIGTKALINKCPQSPRQRETRASCPCRQSPSQKRLTNSNPTKRKVSTEWGLNPNHSQESPLTMQTSSLKCYSHCSTRSSKWWRKSVS